MGWISTALSFVMWVAGLLGFGKTDPVAAAQATGEKLGNLETENASLEKFTDVEQRASDARAAVSDDARVVYDDPDNRRDPAPGPSK